MDIIKIHARNFVCMFVSDVLFPPPRPAPPARPAQVDVERASGDVGIVSGYFVLVLLLIC